MESSLEIIAVYSYVREREHQPLFFLVVVDPLQYYSLLL